MSLLVRDLSGNDPFGGVLVGDSKTKQKGFQNYVLAGTVRADGTVAPLATLASGARTTPIYDVTGGSYNFFAGASAWGTGAAQLQYLGDDGTWYNVDTARTSSGVGSAGVVIGEGSTLAILNSGAGALTNLIAELS